MAVSDINIDLLAQRLAAQEELNSKQAADIAALTTEAAELRGRFAQQDKSSQSSLKLVGPVVGVAFSLLTGFVAYSITGRIDRIEGIVQDDQVEIAQRFERKDQRVAANQMRIEDLEAKKIPSLSDINVTIENINTRLAVIEDNARADDVSRDRINDAVVELQARSGTQAAAIAEHEEEIDALEAEFNESTQRVASIRASVAANFVEVETQIRSWVDTANLRAAYTHSQLQQMQQDIDPTKDLPDIEFFPERIPAQAVTNVGEVGGGN